MNVLDLPFAPARDQVGRIRIQGAAAAAERLRGELRQTGTTAALHPPGLPPATIVCVRSLRTRLGGTERPWSHVSADIERLAATAGRPARDPPGANANAVIFANAAELLACLARDWADGELRAHWWWRALFGRGALEDSARRAWLEHPALLPAALACLAPIDPELRFFERITSDERQLLWNRLLVVFDLPRLRDTAAYQLHESAPDNPARDTRATVASAVSAWAAATVANPARDPSEQRLIMIAALLQTSPGLVRSTAFTREYHGWFAQRRHEFERTKLALAIDARNEDPNRQAVAPSPRIDKPSPAIDPSPPGTRTTPESPRTHSVARPLRPPAKVTPPVADTPLRRNSPAGCAATPSRSDAMPPFDEGPLRRERIETQWGGVFYLVNVALALELYGDFTTPGRPGLALPVWDFLALFGERFVGDVFNADPVTPLLARLAGRLPSEPPGLHFDPPDEKPLARWADETERQLRDRLHAALGPAEPEGLVARVFAHHARISADAMRVEVAFALAEHPIELRLAGLDRDPGWVPAAGRSIAFHYD